MNLIRQPGFTELILLGVFLLFYVLYAIRVYRVNKAIKANAAAAWGKYFLRLLYFSLFLFAFLGPSFGEMKSEVKSVGKDIFIAIDLSRSMDATDVQPSRLAKVKFELKKVINEFSSDRIGLIIFTSDAFMLSPLTFDQSALMMFMETLNTELISNTGTDLAPPLSLAIKKHDDSDDLNPTQPQSQVIILISDGEDFGEETTELAEELKEKGIRLFTLGVGSEEGGKIPQGFRFQRDLQGQEIVSKLNASSLKQLANITGGEYFELSPNQNDIARLTTAIGQIQGEMRDNKTIDTAANKYYYFLLAGVILMLIDVFFTVAIFKL
jgi:Ca-activated chloride channel family protein